MVSRSASGSVLFTTKVMARGADDSLVTLSLLQLLLLELFELVFELVLTSSQFLLLSDIGWLFFFPFLHRTSFRPSAPTLSWVADDSSSPLVSPLLFVALSTMMTAVEESPVPVVSVADAGASNWLRSRRPKGLEKQNISAVQDDTLNACFTPVITKK